MRNEDLLYRSFRAFVRVAAAGESPSNKCSTIEIHDGFRYAVVRDESRHVLAVYRDTGPRIRRVQQWPSTIR